MVYIKKTHRTLKNLMTLAAGLLLIAWVFISDSDKGGGETVIPRVHADSPHSCSDSDAGCATASGTGCGCGYCEDVADVADSDSDSGCADGTDSSGDGGGDNGSTGRA